MLKKFKRKIFESNMSHIKFLIFICSTFYTRILAKNIGFGGKPSGGISGGMDAEGDTGRSFFSIIQEMQLMKFESDMMKKMLNHYTMTEHLIHLGVVIILILVIYSYFKNGSIQEQEEEERNLRPRRRRSNLARKTSSLHIVTAGEVEAMLKNHDASITISDGVRGTGDGIPMAPNPPRNPLFD